MYSSGYCSYVHPMSVFIQIQNVSLIVFWSPYTMPVCIRIRDVYTRVDRFLSGGSVKNYTLSEPLLYST